MRSLHVMAVQLGTRLGSLYRSVVCTSRLVHFAYIGAYGSLCLVSFDLPLVFGGQDLTSGSCCLHVGAYGSLRLVSLICHWCSAVMTSPTRMHTLILMVHCCLRAHPHLWRSTLLTFNGEGERKAGALPCLAGALPCLARIYRLSTTNNCNCWWNDPRQRCTALAGGWLDTHQIVICLTQLDPKTSLAMS